MTAGVRNAWVSYLRGSTPEQAEKDLSIPAQRKAVAAYAERNGKSIDREYLHHLIERIEVDENNIRIIPKEAFWGEN